MPRFRAMDRPCPLRCDRSESALRSESAGAVDIPTADGAMLATARGMADPAKHPDLHGNVPDQCQVALLIVDVVNALRFEGGEAFARRATAAGRRIVELKARASAAHVPVIYVNDNAGRWRSDIRQ